jgi:hypothetical protein
LRDCIALGHEVTRLEELLGLNRAITSVAAYPVATPGNRWEAVQTGAQTAREECSRLGFGVAPVGDVVQLLETQAVQPATVSMPDEISGLTIKKPVRAILPDSAAAASSCKARGGGSILFYRYG